MSDDPSCAHTREAFRIDLPLVPSLNNAYFNARRGSKRGRIPSKRTVTWKEQAGWLVKMASPPRITGPFRFTLLVPENMRGDVSNRPKLAEDLLVSLRVTPDDRHAVETTCRRDASVASGRCIVIVESVDPADKIKVEEFVL